jgi:hypothetical protein
MEAMAIDKSEYSAAGYLGYYVSLYQPEEVQ